MPVSSEILKLIILGGGVVTGSGAIIAGTDADLIGQLFKDSNTNSIAQLPTNPYANFSGNTLTIYASSSTETPIPTPVEPTSVPQAGTPVPTPTVDWDKYAQDHPEYQNHTATPAPTWPDYRQFTSPGSGPRQAPTLYPTIAQNSADNSNNNSKNTASKVQTSNVVAAVPTATATAVPTSANTISQSLDQPSPTPTTAVLVPTANPEPTPASHNSTVDSVQIKDFPQSDWSAIRDLIKHSSSFDRVLNLSDFNSFLSSDKVIKRIGPYINQVRSVFGSLGGPQEAFNYVDYVGGNFPDSNTVIGKWDPVYGGIMLAPGLPHHNFDPNQDHEKAYEDITPIKEYRSQEIYQKLIAAGVPADIAFDLAEFGGREIESFEVNGMSEISSDYRDTVRNFYHDSALNLT